MEIVRPAGRFGCLLIAALALCPALAMGVQPTVEMEGATPRATAVFAIPEVAPWGYRSEDGEPAGVLVAITDRMAELADVPVEYRLRPPKRAVSELKTGEIDYVMLFRSPESDAAGDRVATILETRIVLTTLPDRKAKSLEELEGKSVGYVQGTYYGEAFANAPNISRVAVNNLLHGLEMLDLGRVDALINYDAMLERVIYASDYEATDFHSEGIAEGREGLLYVSRDSPLHDYVSLFQRAIEQMQASGEIVELVRSAR